MLNRVITESLYYHLHHLHLYINQKFKRICIWIKSTQTSDINNISSNQTQTWTLKIKVKLVSWFKPTGHNCYSSLILYCIWKFAKVWTKVSWFDWGTWYWWARILLVTHMNRLFVSPLWSSLLHIRNRVISYVYKGNFSNITILILTTA